MQSAGRRQKQREQPMPSGSTPAPLVEPHPPRLAPPTKHLNQIELARRWNMSVRTLERWRWLKKGPPYLKIGGRVVYRLEDIEAFEAAQLRQADPNAIVGTWRRTPRARKAGKGSPARGR